METPFMEEIPDKDLTKYALQAEQGGEYYARDLIRREQERRAGLAILAIHSVDMPVADPAEYFVPIDPAELTICESCE